MILRTILLSSLLVFPAGRSLSAAEQPDPHLQPVGDGWKVLLNGHDLTGLVAQADFWKIDGDGALHGNNPGTPDHHYSFTEAEFADFEIHADVKMVGYNSGLCIRIAPTSFDNVPGYQVDMGDGYWGCLWDERGQGMVASFPPEKAAELVHAGEWNHYYVRAQGHHIQIWLNGVLTVDTVDENGRLSGPIGFQLCHSGKATEAWFKNIVTRPLPPAS